MADEPRAADNTEKRTRDPGSHTWLWMILALVTVVGFLTWLGMVSEPTAIAVVEEEAGEEPLPPGVTAVEKDSLAADKGGWVGRRIRVSNIAATGNLGPRIFWGELGDPSNQVPILVRLDSAAADGFQAEVGEFYTLTGMVWAMSDSLAGVWYEEGELTGEGERLQASFADYYMQTSRVRPTPESLREAPSEDDGADPISDDGATAGDAGTSG